MLEKRAAASLEPCGLHRVLPQARHNFRSSRRLHTAFWQHGAADLELSNAWQALMHGVFNANTDQADVRTPALRASSSFLLDFLYPNATPTYLRRFTPARQTFARVSPRLYSSSRAPPPSSERPKAEPEDRNSASERADSATSPLVVVEDGSPASPNSLEEPGATHEQHGSAHNLNALIRLLKEDNIRHADKVWHHYSALGDQIKAVYMGQVLVFLSKTGRVSDSWKISELFHQLDPSQWDSYSFTAGLIAEMNLENDDRALKIFAEGFAKPNIDDASLIAALDRMLASALRSVTGFESLKRIWAHYDLLGTRWNLDGIFKQLSRVAAVPGLGGKILDFRQPFKSHEDNEGMRALKKLLVRRAIVSCTNPQMEPLLNMTNDSLTYEEFLRTADVDRQWYVILKVYKRYRKRAETSPTRRILYLVYLSCLKIADKPAQFAAVEELWGDWHTFFGQPSQRAYQKYMSFYASHGDTDKVYKLWADYMQLYSTEANALYGDDTFAHLLQVHTIRRELDQVQRIFADISDKFGIEPNRVCWNILLNAHARVGDYTGAIETFDRTSRAVGVDGQSFGTLMQMAASRGDLAFTLDLYRRMRREKIPTDHVMLSALIEAYCRNDLFNEAENICIRAAKKKIGPGYMWNKVLQAYANRRDLAAVYRVLNIMTDMKIPYDGATYRYLLLGLSLCRQPQHAMNLLVAGVRDGAFAVTAEHFHIVMGAYIKTRQVDLSFRVHVLMEQCGFGRSSTSIVQVATAFKDWERLPRDRRLEASSKKLLVYALREFIAMQRTQQEKKPFAEESNAPASESSGHVSLQSTALAAQFAQMVYLCTQMKDFMKVHELVHLYRSVVGKFSTHDEDLPFALLNAIMLADWHEGSYKRVRDSWEIMFSLAKQGAVWADGVMKAPSLEPSSVPTGLRYILSDGLKIMQEMLVKQKDLAGLQATVESVQTAGFHLDSLNWNLYVQSLVKLKAYKEAFDVCEKWLMPHWTGWAVVRRSQNIMNLLPLEARRMGTVPRYLRPTTHTFYYLVRGYLELEKLGLWSPEAVRAFKHIEEECPQTHLAITSMTLVHSDLEHDILSMDDAVLTADDAVLEDDDAVPENDMESDGSDVRSGV